MAGERIPPSLSDEPDDMSDAEREFRELLVSSGYAAWAKQVRAQWATTPKGILAKRMAPDRTGKTPRRVKIEEK